MGINKEEALKKVNEADEKSEFEVFTSQEYKSFLENYAETEVSKRIGDEVLKIHTQYDTDIFELTGKKRDTNEKTYDFNKRIIGGLKESTKNIPELQEKITKLEDDLKNKAGDEQLKKDYEALKEQIQSDKKTWEEKEKGYESSQDLMKKEIIIDNALAQLNLKPDEVVSKKLKELAIKDAKAELLKMAEMRNGKLVFVENEKPILNDSYEPKEASEMLKDKLSDIIQEGKKVENFPTKKPEIIKDGDKKDINVYIPDNVKSLEDLTKHLMSLGMERSSDEYILAYGKYSEQFRKK